MNYNLLCFQTSGRHIIFFSKHDYQVSTSLMKENKRYKRLKTAKWISIRKLVPGLLLTVRSAGLKLTLLKYMTLQETQEYNRERISLIVPETGVLYNLCFPS